MMNEDQVTVRCFRTFSDEETPREFGPLSRVSAEQLVRELAVSPDNLRIEIVAAEVAVA